MHDSITAGHMGVKRTKSKISEHYYWYNMREDISLYIKGCDVCAADKKSQKLPRAPLGRLGAGAPMDILAIDYMGPFPVTERGNRYILVISDHFTKYVEVLAVPNITAEDCAARILNDIIARWGAPLQIHSDQGATFESRLFKELCKMLQVKKTRTSARHPQCNGQVERFNRTLLKMIRAYLAGEQDEWDLHLGILAGAYRSAPNEATKVTPNMMTIGRDIRLPVDLIYGHEEILPREPDDNPIHYVQSLRNKMHLAHQIARKHLGVNAKRSKAIYDSRVSFNNYKAGDLVWCLHETRKVGVTPKLEKAFEGPFLIKEKLSDLNYVLQIDQKGKERVVHHDKLKLYEGSNAPRWMTKASKLLTKD